MSDARIMVFHDPFGRMVRFLPSLLHEREGLISEGFYHYEGERLRHTQAGWVCHILACEINPRRAHERTTLRLNHRLYWRSKSQDKPFEGKEEDYLPQTKAILADLERRGYITASPYHKTQEAWSLVY
uniref:Uncharacterized protein n=1 Tax=Caulobacter phage BL57 TaxID=3348355 RepID=A0AB74UMM0_9VIRU